MSLFNFYIMVDWSGSASRRGNRPDAIWIASGGTEDEDPETESPFSRTEAVQRLRELMHAHLGKGHRVLLCFDFAYGFPRDFAAALQTATGKGDEIPPWRLVWDYLKSEVEDDGGQSPSRRPNNRSNRFDVANRINSLLSVSSEAAGPFWCAPAEGKYPYLNQKRPPLPFQSAQGFFVQSMRFADQRARSGTPFRLFGHGSVGSQTLTGIPRLHELRFAPEFVARSAVWPFEPGWAAKPDGYPKTLRSCMLRFIRVSENLWRI